MKALSERSRTLILDEPTSALSALEVDRLFVLLRRLRSDGVAIIYVSHRMDEIMRIADRATIMRDGRHAVTAPLSDLCLNKIIEHIIGHASHGLGDVERDEEPNGEALVELRSASGTSKPRNIDLVLNRGEVLGVAGLLGSGRSSLARLLFGVQPLAPGKSSSRAPAQPEIAAGRHRRRHRAHSGGSPPRGSDRTTQRGSKYRLPVSSVSAAVVGCRMSAAAEVSRQQIAQLQIKTALAETSVNTLSGGNQQKVVVGKWLATARAFSFWTSRRRASTSAARARSSDWSGSLRATGARSC